MSDGESEGDGCNGDDGADHLGGVDADREGGGEDDEYRTVAGEGRAAFTVRGSEFEGRVAPARTVADAEAFVDRARNDHPDATHVVPAYRVRADPLREYQDDAGEPGGSAGPPALNVLVQRDLENAVSAVVRYYGGTNLGVGGLARAYGRAVADAVDDAGVVIERPQATLAVTVEYDDSGTVRGILESEGVDFEATYEEDVRFDVTLPAIDVAAIRDRIASATSGRADWEDG